MYRELTQAFVHCDTLDTPTFKAQNGLLHDGVNVLAMNIDGTCICSTLHTPQELLFELQKQFCEGNLVVLDTNLLTIPNEINAQRTRRINGIHEG